MMKKAAVVACSNALSKNAEHQILDLKKILGDMGIEVVCSELLYGKDGTVFAGTPSARAAELMRFYKDPEIQMIFDVSGGDIANGILPFIDFEEIEKSKAVFWGYSDLTTILNAIYAKTGKASVLYQVRNLTDPAGNWQRNAFQNMMREEDRNLFDFSYSFVQGRSMEGIVVGGNIRCLLKLAGTEFWPDMHEKILLLEAYSGLPPQMASFLAQLKQLGVFEQINGILLGTFLGMEKEKGRPEIEQLVREYAGERIPVARTAQIGHRTDSRGILIGRPMKLSQPSL